MTDLPNLAPDPAVDLCDRAWRILRTVGAFGPRVDPAILAASAGANGLRAVWRMSHESYEDLRISDRVEAAVSIWPDETRRTIVVRLFGIEVDPVRVDAPHVGRPDGTSAPVTDPRDLLELVISGGRR